MIARLSSRSVSINHQQSIMWRTAAPLLADTLLAAVCCALFSVDPAMEIRTPRDHDVLPVQLKSF
jgi:hypothetical protein